MNNGNSNKNYFISMKRITVFAICLIFYIFGFSQNNNNLSVEIHESMINKVLKVVGQISGENEYETFLMKGSYKWTVMNPQIKLTDKKAQFVADLKVETGSIQYTDKIVGDFSVTYNQQTNKLELKLTSAIYEIYTKILGQKISIKKINLADYYKDPFLFDGPMEYQSVMPFTMPDKSVKKIAAKVKNCIIQVVPSKIIMNTEVDFFEVKN